MITTANIQPGRPSPSTARCICNNRTRLLPTSHRRTCPDWTQEDADWAAAQWQNAERVRFMAAVDEFKREKLAGLDVTRWHRFRAWLAERIAP